MCLWFNMSVRRGDAPKASVGLEQGFFRGVVPSKVPGQNVDVSAKFNRIPTGRKMTIVDATARGDEIVAVMKEALSATRSKISGKKMGEDHASIEVSSLDLKLVFAITIHIEHEGMNVIMKGNIGGSYKEHKLSSAQKVDDDWIARATAGLFLVAGGVAEDVVKISYYESA